VTPDNVPPHLLGGTICGGNLVGIKFDKNLDQTSANTASHYTISGGVTVNTAALQTDKRTVILGTTPIVNGGCYTLTATGVADSCPGNLVPAGSSVLLRSAVIASGPQHIAVVEAEDYDVNATSAPPLAWTFGNSFPGFSSAGYMESLPDSGVNLGNGPALPQKIYLDYCIQFPVAGNYYFWLRGANDDSGGAGNSVHIAIDGANPNAAENNQVGNNINDWGAVCNTPLGWGWVHISAATTAPSFVTVPSAGIHTFRIWMREDGLKIDQFVLTTDPNFAIADCAPPLGATGRGPSLTVVHNPNGDVVVSWAGTGCRLQASSTLGPTANWQDVATISPFTATGPTSGNKFYRLVNP